MLPSTSQSLNELIQIAAQEVRQRSQAVYGILWGAYLLAGEVLVKLTVQGNDDPVEVTEHQSIRISVTANLVQSVTVPEHLISSGFYWAASAVLRQHMEAIARIIEVRGGSIHKCSQPPNVAMLPFKLNKNYGRLSELAHLSRGEFLADIARIQGGDDTIATCMPTFNATYAEELFSIHLAHLVALIVEIHLLHVDLYSPNTLLELNTELEEIASALVSTGFWKRESA